MNALHRIIVYDSATLMPKLAVLQRIFVCVQVATPRCKIADADANARPCSVRHTYQHGKRSRFTHPRSGPNIIFVGTSLFRFSLRSGKRGEYLSISLGDLPCVPMQDIKCRQGGLASPHQQVSTSPCFISARHLYPHTCLSRVLSYRTAVCLSFQL